MTVVNMDFRRPRADGDHIPARGYVAWAPSTRRDFEGYILLPQPFKVRLNSGSATVTATPTEPNWYWKVSEFFDGVKNVEPRYYIVPDSPTPVDFDDLVQVNNPEFGQPIVAQNWWAAELQALQDSIDAEIAAIIDSAPGALDTLNELAAALGDDANFATTVTNSLAGKATTVDLDAEEAARIAADSGLQGQVTTTATNLATEVGTRTSEVSALDTRLDAVEAADTKIKAFARDLYLPYSTVPMDTQRAQVTLHDANDSGWWSGSANFRWDAADHFTYSGPQTQINPNLDFGMQMDNPNGGYGTSVAGRATPIDVEFIFTGTKLAIMWISFSVMERMQIWIDNQPVILDQFTISTAYGAPLVEVDFGTNTVARVRFAGPRTFVRVHTGSDDDSIKPAATRLRMGVISDSYFNNSDTAAANSITSHIQTLTGWRVWNMTVGGTGYINSGVAPEGRPYNSAERLAEVAAAPIDVLLVNGSVNDLFYVSAPQQANYKQTALDYYAAVAAIKPNLPIIVQGIQSGSYGDGGGGAAIKPLLNDGLQEAADEAPNVVKFINPYEEVWLTGTGNAGAPNGSGNQDWLISSDAVHPSVLGHRYLAQMLVSRMADTVLEVTPNA